MRIGITGGAGFIGSNIARKMIDNGHDVVIFDNLHRKGVERNLDWIPEAEFIKGDIRGVSDVAKMCDVDSIVHCAANPGIPVSIADPIFDLTTNAIGTVNILEHARKVGASVVYCSTNKVYPENLINAIPLIESEKRYDWNNDGFAMTDKVGGCPHSPYGISKLTGEMYCREYEQLFDVPVVINRMSCIYGTHQLGVEDQGWVTHFVVSALKDKKLNFFGNGKQVRDCLFGPDLADLVAIEINDMDKLRGSVFNVGGGPKNTMSLIECTDFLEEQLGIKFDIDYKPWRPADHKVYISDIRKVNEATGWKPQTSVKDGIKKVIDWALEVV